MRGETPNDGAAWSAGTATRDVTPEESLWLAGFASRDEPADGVETPLSARALALDDGDRTLVLVSVEVISIPPVLRENLERRCVDRYGLGPESVAFTATHTHSGPLLQEFRGRMYDVDEETIRASLAYRDRLEDHLVALVGDALAAREPAALEYTHARCGFATNRRRPTPDGIAHDANPDGPVDHDVPVLAVASDGTYEAIVFGYACHATVLKTNRYDGDWPGYAMRYVEERYPDATALFLTGCAGDQNPWPRRRELAEEYGRRMATTVQGALDVPGRRLHGPLRLAHENVSLSFGGYDGRPALEEMTGSEDPYERRHAELLLERLDETGALPTEYPFGMRAIGFGSDLTLLALAGEVVVDYSRRLKAELPGPLWVAAYTSGSFTYVPTRRVLAEGGYEGGGVTRFRRYPGRLEPEVEERVLSTAKALAARVRGPGDGG